MSRGFFITLEGGEGAGKSTQIKKLEPALQALGRDVIVTREPGGTVEGDAMWKLFIHHDGQGWPVEAQAFFMTTLRALHVEQVIRPALEAGKIVVCDRYIDSTRVYQGVAQGFGIDNVDLLSEKAFGNLSPDLTFIFDIDPTIGLTRAVRREKKQTFENVDLSFHQKLRDAYRDIANTHPQRCVMVDASKTIEAIFTDIMSTITARIA